jgi:methanogenic corrinoid protein MtbC1
LSGPSPTQTTIEDLINALLDGDQTLAVSQAAALRDAGMDPDAIITDGVEAAMVRLDAKCTVEQFNLLEIMLAGRAAMAVVRTIVPAGPSLNSSKGTIVIGSVQGDLHDLGKNIFKMILTTTNYRVVDCGKDCPVDELIDAAESEGAMAVGISGLLTTVIPQVRRVRARITERGLESIRVLAGGAALRQADPESLNVDFVAQTAFDGLHYLDELREGGS